VRGDAGCAAPTGGAGGSGWVARGAGGMAVERACWAGVRRVRERGERAGPREIGLGRWRARREREEWAGERLGRAEGSGWCFGFLGFLFYFFFFSISNQTKFEFKYKFEFKPHSNKNMHQHECNTNF